MEAIGEYGRICEGWEEAGGIEVDVGRSEGHVEGDKVLIKSCLDLNGRYDICKN